MPPPREAGAGCYNEEMGTIKNMKKILELVRKHTELLVLFFFLTTSLFLGDGKQPFVDAWWALGILMMYGVRCYQRGKLDLRPLPRAVGWAWTALIVYYIILIPFSDSAGYSITTTIRLIEAYLVYLVFYTISSEKTVIMFTKGLLFVGVVATLASFVFLLSPSLAGFLPPMSLLYATYGHNHLADLLLFIFPIVIAQQSWFLLILFTIGIMFTYARGVWLLLIFYLLFLVWKSKNIIMRRVSLFVAAATVGALLLVSLRGIPTQKPSLLEDGRWEYWRQATEAIKERPFFGSGPGTFFLQSKRLQARPSSYSWFAHSAPLQIAVETGMVGLAIFLFPFWLIFRKSQPNPLLLGVGLVLVYSFYEFTLDYTVMWLLVWAALGTLTKHNTQDRNKSKAVVAPLIILALFYASSIGSTMASVAGNQKLAFYLAPYDTNATKELLEKQKINPPLIMFFHRKNSEVLFAMAQKQPTDGVRCEQLILLDKKNNDVQQKCIRLLFDGEKNTEAAKALYLLALDIVPKEALWRLSPEDFTNIRFSEGIDYTALDESLFSAQNKRYGLAKLMYAIGLQVIVDDPQLTKRLWLLARDTSPGWSYFYVELASLDAWVFRDAQSARRRLARCSELKDPRVHCLYVLTHTIPLVGSQKDSIAAIPTAYDKK